MNCTIRCGDLLLVIPYCQEWIPLFDRVLVSRLYSNGSGCWCTIVDYRRCRLISYFDIDCLMWETMHTYWCPLLSVKWLVLGFFWSWCGGVTVRRGQTPLLLLVVSFPRTNSGIVLFMPLVMQCCKYAQTLRYRLRESLDNTVHYDSCRLHHQSENLSQWCFSF